jgi:hypothetical protein
MVSSSLHLTRTWGQGARGGGWGRGGGGAAATMGPCRLPLPLPLPLPGPVPGHRRGRMHAAQPGPARRGCPRSSRRRAARQPPRQPARAAPRRTFLPRRSLRMTSIMAPPAAGSAGPCPAHRRGLACSAAARWGAAATPLLGGGRGAARRGAARRGAARRCGAPLCVLPVPPAGAHAAAGPLARSERLRGRFGVAAAWAPRGRGGRSGRAREGWGAREGDPRVSAERECGATHSATGRLGAAAASARSAGRSCCIAAVAARPPAPPATHPQRGHSPPPLPVGCVKAARTGGRLLLHTA